MTPDDVPPTGIIPPAPEIPPVSAEELVDGAVPEDADAPRRYPSTIGGAVYLLVLAAAAGGLIVTWFVSWRLGLEIFGGALCFAALVRIILQPRDAGMLAVRNKVFDPLALLVLGVTIIALAATIPSR